MAAIPEGFHTVTPQLHVSNGDKAIALYKKALGAKELRRMLGEQPLFVIAEAGDAHFEVVHHIDVGWLGMLTPV
jgi:uncharacterized glyoxalase superfamily protein PhnB